MKRLAVFLATVIVVCALPTAVQAQTKPGTYYLALGDSLGYGITTEGISPDPQCQSPSAPGYVCVVYGYLKQINPNLTLENLSAPDVDSCGLIHGFGNGSPCTRPESGDLHAPVTQAVAFIQAHQGQVGPVTINVGGADLIPLLPHALTDPAGTAAKLPGIFATYQSNLDTALSALRNALGPSGQLILVTQYNPLGGIGSPPLPAGLPTIAAGAIHSLNTIMGTEAAKYNVQVADVAAAFDANPGGAAVLTFVPTSLASGDPSQIDIYPIAQGYRVYGDTVLRAGDFAVPPFVRVRLKASSVKRGGKLSVRGTAVSGSTVTVKVKAPGVKTRTLAAIQTDNIGTVSTKAPAGKRAGSGSLSVCERDPVSGTSKCSGRLRFHVR